jgi:hypothetical protein
MQVLLLTVRGRNFRFAGKATLVKSSQSFSRRFLISIFATWQSKNYILIVSWNWEKCFLC